jgi:hypothetical protein
MSGTRGAVGTGSGGTGQGRTGSDGRCGRPEGTVRTLTVSGLSPSARDRPSRTPCHRTFRDADPVGRIPFRGAAGEASLPAPVASDDEPQATVPGETRLIRSGVGSALVLRRLYGGSAHALWRVGAGSVALRWRSVAGSIAGASARNVRAPPVVVMAPDARCRALRGHSADDGGRGAGAGAGLRGRGPSIRGRALVLANAHSAALRGRLSGPDPPGPPVRHPSAGPTRGRPGPPATAFVDVVHAAPYVLPWHAREQLRMGMSDAWRDADAPTLAGCRRVGWAKEWECLG